MAVGATLAIGTADAATTVFFENFSGGAAQFVPGWNLAGGVGVSDSTGFQGAGGFNDTGTGNFLAFGAGGTSGGVASTTVSLVARRLYTLSFRHRSFSFDGSTTQSIGVTLDGAPIDAVTTPGSTLDLSQVLSTYTVDFTASAASQVLAFADNSNDATSDSTDGLFDTVVISSAVPEPAAWTMMLGGLGGMVMLARRRRAVIAVA